MENNLAFAILNVRDDILFVSPPALPYFSRHESTVGSAALTAIAAVMESELVATLARTRQTGLVAHARAIPVQTGANAASIRISARMLAGDDIEPGTVVLNFDDIAADASDDNGADRSASQSIISELYAELMLSRDEFTD